MHLSKQEYIVMVIHIYLLSQINSCLEDMLEIEPLELHFPFEHNKAITRSVELI